MEQTPITKLSEAAESGIITNSPALWEEWKKTMDEAFRLEIMKAIYFGQSNPHTSTLDNIVQCNNYYNSTYLIKEDKQ